MKKKAIIVDLDNTIYLVSSIGDRLFKTLFQLITDSGDFIGDFSQVKAEIMRTPFQKVADAFSFGAGLKAEGIRLLEDLTYNGPMETVISYPFLKELPCKKFLVTTGFTKMQHSKIRQLGIENDFERIVVIDPSLTALTKKDVFTEILVDYRYKASDVLIIGDDLNSEIKAGQELGIETVVYDFNHEHTENRNLNVITHFGDLKKFIC